MSSKYTDEWFNSKLDKRGVINNMATKKVVKKVVAKKDKYMYCEEGQSFTYDSVKEIEDEIKAEWSAGEEFEIWQLVKKVRVKRADVTLEEIK